MKKLAPFFILSGNFYRTTINYYALEDKRNIAPEGWRVATCTDWGVLLEYLPTAFYLSGDNIFNGAKYIASQNYWQKSKVDGTVGSKTNKNNGLKFFGLPAGYRQNSGVYKGLTTSAYWWCYSHSNIDEMLAISKSIWFDSNEIQTNLGFKMRGLSVRCVKDL